MNKKKLDEEAEAATARIGPKMKQRRDELGYSQREAAELLGYHHVNLGFIELGKRNVSVQVLWKVAQVYGQSINWFFRE